MDTDDDAYVIEAPDGVPQSNEFAGTKIFVRECYPEYYNLLQAELEEYRWISVTGTPGIGKSLFYLYTFKRYREENRDKRVLTASFSKARKLINCRLWKSLHEIASTGGEQPEYEEYDYIPRKDVLHLYDGPPEVVPS
jgi:hypothetical protein